MSGESQEVTLETGFRQATRKTLRFPPADRLRLPF
jgi:hypothetical protein